MFIFLTFLAIMAALAAFIATRPDDFRITRSAVMAAAPEAIFAQVNDFHKWAAWSPWAALDLNAKNTFEGPASGAGAVFSWAGNSQVGEGRMTIIESTPNERIRIKLEFFKPFAATNTAEFTFTPDGGQTAVSWSMYGKNTFMSKAMSLVMNCDKMLGTQFEKGLAQMKNIAEATSR